MNATQEPVDKDEHTAKQQGVQETGRSTSQDESLGAEQVKAPTAPEFVQSVDTTGLLCPLPILRAKKALQALESGQVLRVFTTDKKAVQDFQAFCQQTKHVLLQQYTQADLSAWHYIQKR